MLSWPSEKMSASIGVRAAGDGLGGEASAVDLDADALDREPRFGQGGEPFGGRLVRP